MADTPAPETPIELEAIESSNLAALGWRPEDNTLAVQFKSGIVIYYAGIDRDTATALYTAESRGSYYSKNIRGKFTATRKTGPCPKCGDEGWIGVKCVDCGCANYEEKRMF